MAKAKNKLISEKTLAERAYAAYMAGRLAGSVTADSPARTTLVQRYSAPSRQPCEVYTFLLGLREAFCPILAPDELLTAVCAALGMAAEGVAS